MQLNWKQEIIQHKKAKDEEELNLEGKYFV